VPSQAPAQALAATQEQEPLAQSAVSQVAFAASTIAQRYGEGAAVVPRTQTKVLDRTSDASMLLPAVGDTVGNYKLEKKLGEGAHGAVFRAHRIGLEEHRVAIKIIPATRDEVALVRQELVTLATVVHPNIVQLTDHGAEAGFAWFSMPLYEGAPLDARLNERFARGETMPLDEAHEIFQPLAGALAALHAAGFRHQDIKPENIFLARFADKEHPILLDLGVAIQKDNQRFLAGTREYFAPEQLDAFLAAMGIRPLPGPPQLGEAMDVYALAATALLAIVGVEHVPGAVLLRPDMAEKDLREVWPEVEAAQKARESDPITKGALRHVAGGPRHEIAAAFKRWFTRNPKARPSAADFARELDVFLSPKRHVEARRRRNARIGIGAAALFLVGAPVAYAGGHYAVTLEECTQRVAQEAKQAGAVSSTLDQCQAQFAALKTEDDTCDKTLATTQAQNTQMQKDFGGKLTSCNNADQQLKSLLAICQTDRDTALGKDKTCEASLTGAQGQLAGCNTSLSGAQQGLATCNASLGSCTSNLSASSAAVAACNTNLAQARDATTRCNTELGTCNTERGTCQNDLGTCRTADTNCANDLATCRSGNQNLTTCQSSLGTCQASLTTAQNDVATCRSSLGACPTELRQCQAALLRCGQPHR
jgi:hypothetical protein